MLSRMLSFLTPDDENRSRYDSEMMCISNIPQITNNV
jgi:hypothetical protein